MTEEDITSLPVHNCYVRATVGTERRPTFSMVTRKPEPGDPEVAARIRKLSEEYTTSTKQIVAREAHEDRLAREMRRTRQRSKHDQPRRKHGPPKSTEAAGSREGASNETAGIQVDVETQGKPVPNTADRAEKTEKTHTKEETP